MPRVKPIAEKRFWAATKSRSVLSYTLNHIMKAHLGCSKRPLVSPAQPRRAKTRRSAGKAAASEEARHTLRYVEPLSAARIPLVDFLNILLGRGVIHAD